MGPPGVGKSVCIDILLKALSSMPDSIVHKLIRMSPKSITTHQMYGTQDVYANEWKDGIFSAIWRRVNRQKNSSTWVQYHTFIYLLN